MDIPLNGGMERTLDIPLNGGIGGTLDIPLTGGTGGTIDIPLNLLFSSSFKLTEKYKFFFKEIPPRKLSDERKNVIIFQKRIPGYAFVTEK
jgi:hypothetical protein